VKFGNYRLIQKIATGGMAEVWLAEQEGIEGFSRKVVVKRILPAFAQNPTFVSMFLNEARVASQLSHHNIVHINDLGERDGEYFLAMEYIHGRDLGRVMHRSLEMERWVTPGVALRMVADACAGLYYAHTREDAQGRPLGLVHRDISAQNILVSFNGSVKLVDFGIAKAANQSTGTQTGMVKGKFAYMSPEQAAGHALDARADIFSLGLVLYELLTAIRPLKRDSDLATWQAATRAEILKPSEVANVSRQLDTLVMNALAKKADDRYADASAFQMAIEEYLVGNGLLVTSLQIADLLTELFPEWLEEKALLGANLSQGQGQKAGALSRTASARSGNGRLREQTEDMEAGALQQVGVSETLRSKSVRIRGKEQKKEAIGSLAHEVTPIEDRVVSSREGRALGVNKKGMPMASKLGGGVPIFLRFWRGMRLSSKLWVGGGIIGLLVLMVVLGFIFGAPPEALPPGAPLYLSISTTPPTQVYVLRGERGKRVYMGATPLERRPGVVAGEKLLLLNEASNIHYETTLPLLAEGEVFEFEKKFEEGRLKILTHPERMEGMEVFRKGTGKALGMVGLPIPLYEGAYELELRGKALKEPVAFKAEVKAGKKMTQVTVDLSDFLLKSR